MIDSPQVERGREAVESALIVAASELLAEVGPKSMSVRDVAVRAGVNHGQVHHYFGGKQGLVQAALRHLASEHFAHVVQNSEPGAYPDALTLGQNQSYLRAVVRVILDGDLESAAIEIADDVSVARRSLAELTRRSGGELDIATRAAFTAGLALELGWAAFEPFLFMLANVDRADEDAVREIVRKIARPAQ